jgi:hypothetical protein
LNQKTRTAGVQSIRAQTANLPSFGGNKQDKGHSPLSCFVFLYGSSLMLRSVLWYNPFDGNMEQACGIGIRGREQLFIQMKIKTE